MARIRTIKPEFFDDPAVAELSPLARLFFIGLWLNADKEGLLIDDMKRLKAKILPYDDVDCEPLAVELHVKDMIRRYPAVEKHGYIWLRNFTKHQRPHPKEPASVIPPIDQHAGKYHGGPCKETATQGKETERTSVLGREGKEFLDKGKESLSTGVVEKHGTNGTGHTHQPIPDLDLRWEEFKTAYPGKRRENSYMAQQLFICACEKVGFSVVMTGLERLKKSEDWKRGIIPGMPKFLEAELWIQEPDTPDKGNDIARAHYEEIQRRKTQ